MTGPAPEERLARVALNAVSEPGDPRVARLVAQIGAPALAERLFADAELTGLGADASDRLAGLEAERILSQAERQGIRFVVPGDEEWPESLSDLDLIEPHNRLGGQPVGLWVKGPVRLAEALAGSVAIVGSRSATSYGTTVAGELASFLGQQGSTVVSGAAFGIDQAAHRGALGGGGVTVAVLACGVDRAYPTAHRELLGYLAQHDAVVSELRPGCSPTRVRFLARNRIIAALTQGTVVVEAAVRSGALNTAAWASRLNRSLMGVPGPVGNAPSEGVHELLRSGAATLVARGEHVLEIVSPAGERLASVPQSPARPTDGLTLSDQRVLDAVPLVRPAALASIALTAGVEARETRAGLQRLLAVGLVRADQGRWRRNTG